MAMKVTPLAVGAVDHVVDGDDVGVREDAGALRLADEAGAELRQLGAVHGRELARKVLSATSRPISGSRAR